MDKDKSKSVLINYQIGIWSRDKEIKLIDKKLMPIKFNLVNIGDSILIKNSLENGNKFILVKGMPHSAIDIVNEAKSRLARSIAKVMLENEIICMEDLILEIEEERAKKNTRTGEVRIINCLDEEKVNTTEDLIKKVLESANEELMVDAISSNNVEEYVLNGGGSIIENFIKSLIRGMQNNEDKELMKAFECLDGAWDVVDVLNEKVDEYIRKVN